MIDGKTREENIAIMTEYLGMSEEEAEFICAIELGEITGDLEEVSEAEIG